MTAPDEGVIREQAYYLWEQDGRPDGREMEYWQRATVLAAEKSQVDTITKAPPKRLTSRTKSAEPEKKVAAAASKLKAAPARSSKADAKAKPKKK